MTKTVAVCAVKGGVGKTIVSLNVARKLKERGHTVGLIDCDVDNSNFANFTGTKAEIQVDAQKRFVPYDWDGIKVFSMSLIAGREKAVSMTGDRYMMILDDVAISSDWGEPDFFVLDLPAGSGDIFRIAMDIFAETLVGNIVVTQPTVVDATRRVLNLHKYLEIPLIGVIENMSYFTCTDHQGAAEPKVWYPFGQGQTEKLAEEFGVEILGKIPLSLTLAEGIASGNPILPDDLSGPIVTGCDRLEKAETPKVGFIERVKQAAIDMVKPEVEKVLGAILASTRKQFDIGRLRTEEGFTQSRPLLFVITDEANTKEITKWPLVLEEKGFTYLEPRDKKILKDDALYDAWIREHCDFQISTSFKTLARVIMAKRKLGDRIVPFDPVDAWLMNDIKVYGKGYSPRAVDVFRSVFSDQAVMESLRQTYGKGLEMWI